MSVKVRDPRNYFDNNGPLSDDNVQCGNIEVVVQSSCEHAGDFKDCEEYEDEDDMAICKKFLKIITMPPEKRPSKFEELKALLLKQC